MCEIVCLGVAPTVGFIEAMLMLAENLPHASARHETKSSRDSAGPATKVKDEMHGTENRQSWMMIGIAIRCAYGLEIDKVSWAFFWPINTLKES